MRLWGVRQGGRLCAAPIQSPRPRCRCCWAPATAAATRPSTSPVHRCRPFPRASRTTAIQCRARLWRCLPRCAQRLLTGRRHAAGATLTGGRDSHRHPVCGTDVEAGRRSGEERTESRRRWAQEKRSGWQAAAEVPSGEDREWTPSASSAAPIEPSVGRSVQVLASGMQVDSGWRRRSCLSPPRGAAVPATRTTAPRCPPAVAAAPPPTAPPHLWSPHALKRRRLGERRGGWSASWPTRGGRRGREGSAA